MIMEYRGFLHRHPKMEEMCLPDMREVKAGKADLVSKKGGEALTGKDVHEHVIVDKKDWEETRDMFDALKSYLKWIDCDALGIPSAIVNFRDKK